MNIEGIITLQIFYLITIYSTTSGLTVISKKGAILYFARVHLRNWTYRNKSKKREKLKRMMMRYPRNAKVLIIQEKLDNTLFPREYIGKPLLLCSTCMSSFYGIMIFIITVYFGVPVTPYTLFAVITAILGTATLNYLTFK